MGRYSKAYHLFGMHYSLAGFGRSEVAKQRLRIIEFYNGGENLVEFDKALEDDGVSHLSSYPRCPKINAHIERYNILYNTTRPHKSPGLKTG